MTSLFPEPEKIPLSELPYGFTNRLISLDPRGFGNDFTKVCKNAKKSSHIRPATYNRVLITDNEQCRRWASSTSFLLCTSANTYVSAVQSVLSVADIIDRKQCIYVTDTLILYCYSNESYEQVLPFICGPYRGVVLHGGINVKHVKQIIRPGLKKIHNNAIIVMEPEEHEDFGNYVAKHVHNYNSSFLFTRSVYLGEPFKKLLKKACKRYRNVYLDNEVSVSISDGLFFGCDPARLLLCAVIFFSSCLMFLIGYPPVGILIFCVYVIICYFMFMKFVFCNDE